MTSSFSAVLSTVWAYIFSVLPFSELLVTFFAYPFFVRLKRRFLHSTLGTPIQPSTSTLAAVAVEEAESPNLEVYDSSASERARKDNLRTSATERVELGRVMPYVVPTSPTSTSPRSPFSPGTTTLALGSSPPIPLSISLSSPAPVPNFIPFPPAPPSTSSRIDDLTSPLSASAPSGSSAINMSYVFPRPALPFLFKSRSETPTSTVSTPSSHASSSTTPSPPRSTPSDSSFSPRLTRRSASTPDTNASPLAAHSSRHHKRASHSDIFAADLDRHENGAGRGLTHIPRRTLSSGSSSLLVASESTQSVGGSTPTKRVSRFVVGSDGSGSDDNTNKKEAEEKSLKEREARKRPVSAERSKRAPKPADSSKKNVAAEDDGLVFQMDLGEASSTSIANISASSGSPKRTTFKLPLVKGEDSDSDSVNPMPTGGPRDRESRGRREREKVLDGSRSSRASGMKRRRSGLGNEAAVETFAPEARSSVAFPSSSPPKGNSTNTLDSSRSLAGKRSNAGSLHIDIPKLPSSPSTSPTEAVAESSSAPVAEGIQIPTGPGEGHHGRLHLTRANYSPPAVKVVTSLLPSIRVASSSRSPPAPSTGGALRTSVSTSMVPLIRKKSGEILKPSLKRRSSSASGGARAAISSLSLGDLTGLQGLSPSLSAPATPSAMDDDDLCSVPSSVQSATVKMVHFDAQLEHVKLFLREQKPAAVSRDGSPTMDDTTSGGESGTEWDAFNYGGGAGGYFGQRRKRLTDGATSEEEAAVRKVLVMRVLNMPNRNAKGVSGSTLGSHPGDFHVVENWNTGNVWLEGLHLADDASCVKGTVRVRNIAFEKSVVVRFTFDGWQTTSEVSARWIQSCSPPPHVSSPLLSEMKTKNTDTAIVPEASTASTGSASEERPTYDRFEFAIRLSDLLLRIDEKTLVLAVRYNSAGKEMWDNNSGQNYRAVFEKRVPGKNAISFSGATVSAPGSGNGGLGGNGEGGNGGGGGRDNALGLSLAGALERIASGGKGGGARDSDSSSSSGSGSSTSTKKNADPLAQRYDLGASLKKYTSWRASNEQAAKWVPPSTQNFSPSPPKIPWPTKANASQIDGLPQTWGNIKFPTFTSHRVDFGARAQGLARGSPRDPELDNLDDEELGKYQRRAGLLHMDEQNSLLGAPFQRRESDLSSSGASGSHASPSKHGQAGHNVRNHHRSYFDAWAASHGTGHAGKTRLTPPGIPHRSLSDAELTAAIGSQASSLAGTPISELPFVAGSTSPGRYHSFPPLGAGSSSPSAPGIQHQKFRPWADMSHGTVQMGMSSHGLGLGARKVGDVAESEISTPSITNMSSPTMTPSPASPPDFAMLSPNVIPTVATSPIMNGSPENALMDSSSYSMLLNKFCFYTGRDALLDVPHDMRRSLSASSVEEFLSSPATTSPPPSKDIGTSTSSATPRAMTPPRNANLENLSSGSSTPTAASLLRSESPLATPVRG